ncbi:MAG: FAD-dependent oxidoreductase [Acidimicrobiia bacterium]|nr:FAD-dependent oxidoreductase [Acidimicrobiia bacterium]
MNVDTATKRPLWWEAVDAKPTRASLSGDLDVDVAIVGAGYTGLWTAYYLAEHDPSLRIAVLESHHVGFGASGRNGGWCHSEYPLGIGVLAKDHGNAAALRHMDALNRTVDEVGRVAQLEGIDCHYAKGGVLAVARSQTQLEGVEHEMAEAKRIGVGEEDLVRLTGPEAREMLNATDVIGGTWHPHGAAIQPALLVHGLAAAVERRGVTIFESTRATDIAPGVVTTGFGAVRADMVVRATEGYTSELPGLERTMVPLYSLMVATEPLSDELWDEIGLHNRPTFADYRNLIIYGQRTSDGRFAFGGRGAPYYWRSGIADGNDIHDGVHREIVRALLELFPVLHDVEVTHRWGGPLGAPRDWKPSVSIDRAAKLSWAGGYVGDGVNTAALAGRTLADLILERDTDLVTLPWVNHRWKQWEPEPLRWIGINAGLEMAKRADANEERFGKPSRLATLGNWLRGKTR